jgi:hypothetical protein
MADTLRIKRRAVGGAAGAPATLAAAELAYNEQDDTLYYGKGNSGGNATSVIPIAGSGAFQPKDADLTALAALTGTNVIYYRSAADTWASVTVGAGLSFAAGVLQATGGAGTGNVNNTGTPVAGQLAQWVSATVIQGIDASALGFARLASANTFTAQNCFTNKGVVIGHTAAVTADRSLELHGSSGSVVDGVIQQANWANGSAAETHYFDKSRGTTVGSHVAVQSGDSLGNITFRGSNGTNFSTAGVIYCTASAAPSGGNLPGTIAISATRSDGGLPICAAFTPQYCNFIGQTNTADSAPTGYVGEYLTQSASSVALTSGAYTAVTSRSIPAGDWDVRAVVRVSGTAGSYMYCNVYTSPASSSGSPNDTQTGVFTGLGDCWTAVGPFRVNLSTPTTYYLNIYVATAGCSCVFGEIQLRRRH